MNKTEKYARALCLTLFDGGGASAGGQGAASGEATGTPAGTGAGNRAENKTGSPDAGEKTADGAVMTDEKARREEFDRLIHTQYKDLYTEATQRMIDRRFKQTKELEEKAGKMQPILERLSEKYGESDPDKLLKAMDDDDSYYEREAMEKGMTVGQLKEFKRIERENAAFKRAAQEQQRQAEAQKVYAGWMQQAETLKQIYPSFDLKAECQNDTFVNLLKNNVDVKTAYEVIHRDDILGGAMAYTAQQVRQHVVSDIQARGMRPAENGTSSAPAAVTKPDVNKMTKAQREEIEKRVLRGERIVL